MQAYSNNKLIFVGFLLIGMSGALAGRVNAQSESTELQEVVVTSQKYEEKLRDVPESISVLSGTRLAQDHVQGYDDIARIVPGVSFSANTGPVAGAGLGSEGIQIRGIVSAVGSATVGIYVDDVPVTVPTQAGTFAPMLFDLDRVEVLRGPQGTLYGASSEGGTIRFLTNQPKLDTEELIVSGDGSHTFHGSFNTEDTVIFNVPIVTGELALRGGVEIASQSGWIDRYAHAPGDVLTRSDQLIKPGTNNERDVAVHLALKYAPSADLSVTPALIFQRQVQDDTPVFFIGEGTYNQSKAIEEPAQDTDFIPSLTINANAGIGQLTSVTSYFYRHFKHTRDGTYYDPDFVVPDCLDVGAECGYNPNPGTFNTSSKAAIADQELATLPTTAIDDEHTRVATEELRLASASRAQSHSRSDWIIGLYASKIIDHLNHNENAPGWDSLFNQIYGFSPNNPVLSPISDVTNPNLWQNDSFYSFWTSRGYTQLAGFAQTDYAILSNLIATVGLRYQHTGITYQRFGQGFYDIGVQHSYGSSTNDHAITPRFSLKYDLSDDVNVYASAAKGYRDAGINDPVPQTICGPYEKQIGITGTPPSSYNPDQLWSFELGSKGLYDDHQLAVNADAYFIRWSGLQQQIFIPVCTFPYIANVGDAKAYGSEIEILYKFRSIPGLTMGFNGSAEHAVITSSSGASPAAVGDDLLFTPKWAGTITGDYRRPISENLSMYVRADYDWTGSSSGDYVVTATDHINKQYGVLNTSLGITTGNGLDVQLYAKNLLNNSTIIREPTIADVTEAYTVRPLTIGLRVQKKFQ